jgi:hypothetical protein
MENRFQEKVEMNQRFEKVGNDLMDSVMEMAKEIAKKPEHTETEKKFLKYVALFAVHMLIQNVAGGGR